MFVSMIAVLLCGLYILSVYQGGRFIDDRAVLSAMESEVNSAITLAMANPKSVSTAKTSVDIFEETPYDVSTSYSSWGVYQMLTAEARHNSLYYGKKLLLGETSPDFFSVAMYVPNNVRYIWASGKTIIKGSCYLPENGMRPDYSGRDGFVGDSLPFGKVLKSEKTLPAIDLQALKQAFSPSSSNDSGIVTSGVDRLQEPQVIENSFNNATANFYSGGDITISCTLLSGNIIVRSLTQITVSSGCRLHHVILIAPTIVIERDFTGDFQAFAKREISVGENANLLFPSSLVLVEDTTYSKKSSCFIYIKSDATVRGTMCFMSSSMFSSASRVVIDKDATVYGLVYSNSKTEVKGRVFGSVYTNSFYLQTPSSITENLLHNAEINVRQLPRQFSNASIFKEKTTLKEIETMR